MSGVKARTLSVGSAATMLAVNYRQAKRLAQRYRAEGATGLKHRRAGDASNHARPTAERERAASRVVGSEPAMSDTLRMAQADAKTKLARMPQERRSGSRPTSRSPRFRACVSSRECSAASTDIETFRAGEEGVDAVVPVGTQLSTKSDQVHTPWRPQAITKNGGFLSRVDIVKKNA